MAFFLPQAPPKVFGSQINRTQLGAHLRTCSKKLTTRWFNSWPFFAMVSSRDPNSRGENKWPPTIGDEVGALCLNHLANGVFCLPCWDCTTLVPPQNQPTLGVRMTPRTSPLHLEEVFPPSVFVQGFRHSTKNPPWNTPEFSGHLISGNYRIPTIHVQVQAVSFRKGSKKNIHAMWFKLWPLYPRSLEVT